MIGIDDIVQKVRTYLPNADVSLIYKAYEYAEEIHRGTKRLSGEPFIQHPLGVANLVADLKLDVISICAALLHDVKEDAPEKTTNMEEIFGSEITSLVDGVTKLAKYHFTSKEESQAENFKKMLVAMSKDIRVLLVKLCDRLHNMRDLNYLPPQKQKENAEETLTIYAPLAERLGIAWIRTELEDHAFRYLWPEEYNELKEKAERRLKERASFVNSVIEAIKETLTKAGLQGFEVQGRPKNLYGIFKKMRRQGIEFDHVYDFVAFRVIVKEVMDCWVVLGHIHNLWTPITARFKDFINCPKQNGYRSLHTTVISPSGAPMEIQIRTYEMHRVAESGIAAHWKYKEGGAIQIKDQERFNWIRQLIEWAQEVPNPKQFLDTVQESLFTDQIFVFTPKGDLVVLPRGATPVDFAYEIHTQVGHQCTGARINNRLYPLSTPLRSGDMVEIITSKNGRPKRDWLSFVITAKAKNKIRQFFVQEERAHAIEIGRQVLEKDLRKRGLGIRRILEPGEEQQKVFQRFKISSVEELFKAVGTGKIETQEVITMLGGGEAVEDDTMFLKQPSRLQEFFKKRPEGIAVDGVEDVLLRLGKCCNPIPGDEIMAFVTRGRGVTIHRRDCPSMIAVDPDRLLFAHWVQANEGLYQVPLLVRCLDQPGVLSRVTKEIGDRKSNIASVVTRRLEDGLTDVKFILEVRDYYQLESIMRALQRCKGVLSVERLRQSEIGG